MIDDEWIQLCKDELEAISEASWTLLLDAVANGWFTDESRPKEERQAEIDRRRAELYRQHLNAAGIEIRRVPSSDQCGYRCCGDRCTKPHAHEGDHDF